MLGSQWMLRQPCSRLWPASCRGIRGIRGTDQPKVVHRALAQSYFYRKKTSVKSTVSCLLHNPINILQCCCWCIIYRQCVSCHVVASSLWKLPIIYWRCNICNGKGTTSYQGVKKQDILYWRCSIHQPKPSSLNASQMSCNPECVWIAHLEKELLIFQVNPFRIGKWFVDLNMWTTQH